MTGEEAKEFLINISYKLGNMSVEYLTEKDGEKMREAIKALEQEPFINKPCVSSGVCEYDKNEALNKIRTEIMKLQLYKMFEGEDTFYIERDKVLAIIDKYKAESEVKQ